MNRTLNLILAAAGLLVSIHSIAGKDITEYQVPPAVLTAFKSAYPNATDVEYEENMKNGVKVYEVEFKVNDVKYEVDYSVEGKVLKEEGADKDD